jgi:hypothetical protein
MFFANNIHAELNAFITDEYSRPGNQLPDFVLRFAAEGAVQGILGIARFTAHDPVLISALKTRRKRPAYATKPEA